MKVDVTLATVKKYVKNRDIDSKLWSLAEKHGASRDGLSKLWNSRGLFKQHAMDKLFARFVRRDGIKGSDVEPILKVAKVLQFNNLSDAEQEHCINEAIDKAAFTSRNAKEIVYKQLIHRNYDPEAVMFLYDKLYEYLAFVGAIKSAPYFYDNLTVKQRKHLNDLWRSAWIPISPPLKWDDFPNDHPTDEEEPHPPYN